MTKLTNRGLGYPRPFRRRPPAMTLAGPAPALAIRGIEITQCVQDMANSVDLIADKTGVARVYLDAATTGRSGKVAGEIAWSRGAAETYLPGLNAVTLDSAKPVTHRAAEPLLVCREVRTPRQGERQGEGGRATGLHAAELHGAPSTIRHRGGVQRTSAHPMPESAGAQAAGTEADYQGTL